MTPEYLRYPLANGYIHNWLCAGPAATAVPDLSLFAGSELKPAIARRFHQPEPGIDTDAAEDAEVNGVADFTGRWRYVRCDDDHFVDFSAFYHNCHYLRAWAYAEIESDASRNAVFAVTSNGPVDLWINGVLAHRHEHFHHQQPRPVSFNAALNAGVNQILVRLAAVAIRECPFALALRIDGPPDDCAVRLPSTVRPVERRRAFETLFDGAVLDRDVFAHDEQIVLRWPVEAPGSLDCAIRLQRPDGRIYAEALRKISGGARVELGQALQFPEGEYRIVIMPGPVEYYEGRMRIARELPLSLTGNAYASRPYGARRERALEALNDAARREDSIFNDIARMALGTWIHVDEQRLLKQIASIDSRADCSDFYLCALLGARYRFGDDARFPAAVRGALDRCITGFRYSGDEPGGDAMNTTTENHRILFHTCEVLAGQLFPETVFGNNGQTGAWRRAHGERAAMDWLAAKAAGGFVEWESNCYFEEDVLALTHLADLAEDDSLAALAAVLLDKLFFCMAVNSRRGVFGATHGRAYTQQILGGRRESTSGIGRILWGMGVFNSNVRATVSLACSNYELPPVIAAIACDEPEAMLNQERISGTMQTFVESGKMYGPEVNLSSFKTPDYLLSAALDYHPGKEGYQQHIWQATLDHDAVVFVTHPPNISRDNSRRPNFWHGNLTLPRVAMHRDALIAIHNAGADDWLEFTHAYFPLYAFDQHVFMRVAGADWAFARRGNGYLALCAMGGLTPSTQGHAAARELRSPGRANIWLCQMGRTAQDGAFEDFIARINAAPPRFDAAALTVSWPTIRGDTLSFGWSGPFLRSGQTEPLRFERHMANPYCSVDTAAPHMDIRLGDDLLRLDLEEPK